MSDYLENQEKADRAFSHYVRTRDCLRTTGSVEYGRCFTCGNAVPYAESQCGHFIKRACKALRYERRNAHLQCKECNEFFGGNMDVYEANVLALYGADILTEFYNMRWYSAKTYSAVDLVDVEKQFKYMRSQLTVASCGDPFPFIQITKSQARRTAFESARQDDLIFDPVGL